ncbi:hypothetical protein JCM5350_007247 [Sporobolomyces pararoseus]
MLIDHTEILNPVWKQEYGNYSTRNIPVWQTISCPELHGLDLKVGFDYNKEKYCLDWGSNSKPFDPLKISEGSITIKEGSEGPGREWIIPLTGSVLPFVPQATLYSPKFSTPVSASARIVIKIASPGESMHPEIETIAANSAASLLAREPNNVCFYFPRTSRRIWANEIVLRKASPYFETLFSSDFSESTPSPPLGAASTKPHLPYTYADSDEEADLTPTKKESSVWKEEEEERRAKSFEAFPFKTITVLDTTYTTYLSVLLWISTKHISFAPLLSTIDVKFVPRLQRQAEIATLKSKMKVRLPDPVSSKSVYRLAHLLELSDLKHLALTNYKSQLTVGGAFSELYGDVSCAYPEIQEITLKFVVDNWREIASNYSVYQIEKKMENGGGNSAMAAIGIKLARRLMEKYGSK